MCQNVKTAIYLQFTPQLSGQTNLATSSISSNTILVDTGRRNLKASEVVSLNTVQSISQRSVSKLGRDTEVAVTLTSGVIIKILIIMKITCDTEFAMTSSTDRISTIDGISHTSSGHLTLDNSADLRCSHDGRRTREATSLPALLLVQRPPGDRD